MKISKIQFVLAATILAFGTYGCDKGEAIGGCSTADDCPDANIYVCDSGICKEINATHCSNKQKDSDETDVDCGGNDCAKCKVGKDCRENRDCSSGKCQDNVCVKDACESNDECATGACDNGVCATCNDGKLNHTETDIDCGGEHCDACDVGKNCDADSDCKSKVCTDGMCGAPACKNDDDCSDGAVCDLDTETCISCKDGTKNGEETDVDCGGSAGCNPCPVGKSCEVSSDCVSGICSKDFVCLEKAAASCTDGEKNGNETDVDCGGGTCPLCGQERLCVVDSDCKSGICEDGYCKGDECTSANAGTLVINEVFTNPDTTANMLHTESTKQMKYIEIYNTSDAIVNLAELKLEVKGADSVQSLQMRGCIDSKHYLVLHDMAYKLDAMAEGSSDQSVSQIDAALASTAAYTIELKRGGDMIHAVSVPDMSAKQGVSAALSSSPVETDGYDALVEHDSLSGEGGVDNPHSPGVYNYAGAPQG